MTFSRGPVQCLLILRQTIKAVDIRAGLRIICHVSKESLKKGAETTPPSLTIISWGRGLLVTEVIRGDLGSHTSDAAVATGRPPSRLRINFRPA